MSQKVAFITGITGQDGSYLTEILCEKNYIIHGLIRRSSTGSTGRLREVMEKNKNLKNRLFLHHGDLEDMAGLIMTLNSIKPDEIYNLGCQSHVKVSFEVPVYTCQVAAIGFLNLLEAVKACNMTKSVRIYQASSSEMYGENRDLILNEESKFEPCSPYGVSKVFSHNLASVYRNGFKMFISCGILFNHESPRRNAAFVTRKISRAVANIKRGTQTFVELGNLEAVRDWGHAKDYVEAMWLILQHSVPTDFVISTGVCISVRNFTELCFSFIDIHLKWEGTGDSEVGVDQNGVIRVKVNPKFYREKEVDHLCGDYSKAKTCLNWTPKITINELAREMVFYDYENPDLEPIE